MIGTWHFRYHGRFYLAVAAGIAAWLAALPLPWALRALVSGDAFFVVYLGLMTVVAIRITSDGLRRRASEEDVGAFLIILLALAAIVFSLGAIFMVLNRDSPPAWFELCLAIASVPLGWLMLHTIAAFHYAHLHYSLEEHGCLKFPGHGEPGAWDFLYFSFVIGMTAQVSDVVVETTPMRRLVLAHGVISFFYNTVLVALAVNVAVTLAR